MSSVQAPITLYSFLSYRSLEKRYLYPLRSSEFFAIQNGYESTQIQDFAVGIVDDQTSLDLIYRVAQQMPLVAFDAVRSQRYQAYFLGPDVALETFIHALRSFYQHAKEDRVSEQWLGEGEIFEDLKKFLVLAATHSECSVLISGESGTGKEIFAQEIHHRTFGRTKQFVGVNCAALSSELIDTELFGHEKGAFTGAICSRKGKFEQAGDGTLFLDEIGDMPKNTQVKLLRVLEERSFERLGSNHSIDLKARIISATNQDLYLLMKEKEFREDLFYRMNVLPVSLPPLRLYLEQLEHLIAHLTVQHRFSFVLSSDSISSLKKYSWPGNIRQLCHVLKRLDVFFHHQKITTDNIQKILSVEPYFSSLA